MNEPVATTVETKNSGDSIILIQLSDSIQFHWDNRKYVIIDDRLFRRAAMAFRKNKDIVVEQIINEEKTSARVCGMERNLVIGDLAFLLIDEIENIPHIDALHVQWDAFDFECPLRNWYVRKHK